METRNFKFEISKIGSRTKMKDVEIVKDFIVKVAKKTCDTGFKVPSQEDVQNQINKVYIKRKSMTDEQGSFTSYFAKIDGEIYDKMFIMDGEILELNLNESAKATYNS